MKKAIRIIAHTVTAECPCGGRVIDTKYTHSGYNLESDSTNRLVCDTCDAKIRLGKHVRLFS